VGLNPFLPAWKHVFGMDTISLCAAIITYYRKNASRRSSKPWVSWRNLVLEYYNQKYEHAQINLLINEGVRYASRLHSHEDVRSHLQEHKGELTEALILLDAFFLIVKRHNEFLAEKLHRTNWESLLDKLKFRGQERSRMEERSADLVERFEDNSFYLSITTRVSIWLLVTDYIVRWGVLGLLRMGKLDMPNQNTLGFANIEGFFLVIQIFLIPFLIVLAGVFRNRYVQGKLKALTREIGLWNIRFGVKYSSWEYSLIVFFMLTGIYISYTMVPGSQVECMLLAGITGMFYLGYLMVVLRLFSSRVPSIDRINEELLKNEQSGIAKELDPDENDEEIVNLEVKLRSVNERMNAYVLEATLFGALAFSGFLQIVASEVFTIADIKLFTVGLFQLFDGIVHFDMRYFPEFMSLLHSREGLLALICYETLFCSVFFLSVIASRLRFSDLTDYMDRALQLSRAYNLKEEDLLNNQDKDMNDSRVQKFNRQIREVLKVGNQKQKKIGPIMEYMAFFRNMGVISFFIILITAGLFISVELALIFVLILLLSFLYFKFDNIIFFFQSMSFRIEEFYFRVYQYVNRAALVVIGISAIMRSLGLQIGEFLLLLGFLTLIMHNLLSLFVPEIDKSAVGMENESNLSKALPKLFRIALSIFFLGWFFSIQHFPGAEAVFTVSGIAFCLYFFFAPLLKKETSALRLLTNMTLGLAPLPLIFLVNRLVMSDLLFMIEVPLLIVLLYNAYTNRQNFSPFIVRASVFFLLLYSVHFFSFSSYAFESLRFDPAGYQAYVVKGHLQSQIERFSSPRSQHEYTALLNAKTRFVEEIVDSTDYRKLNQEAEGMMRIGLEDERFLELADELLAMSQRQKKFSGNYENRLEVLIDLGRIAQAKRLAEEYLE
jgi:hypothetical protein